MLKRNQRLKHWRMLLKIWKKYVWVTAVHTWISIFDIAIPYLRPNKAINWNFLVPRGLFVTKSPCSSPFSPAQHNCRREESPNMWHTYLGQVFIFLKDLRRVIMKTEVRKIIFGHAVIAWIFLLIFYFCKIKSFGHSKVRFQGKKQKDMADDGKQFLLINQFNLTKQFWKN